MKWKVFSRDSAIADDYEVRLVPNLLKRFFSIPFAAIALTLMISALGCKNPDQQPLAVLFEEIGEHVTGKLRPEISELPREQRSITFYRDQCRDECEVLDRFLQSNPKLTAATKKTVIEFREASQDVVEYYDAFIKNNNYDLTESERQQGSELLDLVLVRMDELAQIVDGSKRL